MPCKIELCREPLTNKKNSLCKVNINYSLWIGIGIQLSPQLWNKKKSVFLRYKQNFTSMERSNPPYPHRKMGTKNSLALRMAPVRFFLLLTCRIYAGGKVCLREVSLFGAAAKHPLSCNSIQHSVKNKFKKIYWEILYEMILSRVLQYFKINFCSQRN